MMTELEARRLHESEERFRTLAETIPQIVFSTDGEGHIDFLNGKWFEFTGNDPQKGPSSDQILAAIHPDELLDMQSSWKKCRETSAPFNLECRLRAKNGEYRWFLSRAMPLFDGQGRTTRWFGSCTDIDQQKRLSDELREARERAESASRMKSQFLANMSHEIRTPLGAILGFTELLGDKDLDESERSEFLGVIARNGASLSRIVDDVLDLSKVEAGLLNFEKTPFCPRTLASDIVTLFSERARTKGLTLELDISDGVPESLVSDAARIRQIVSNLVSNSLKFTETGFVKLKVQSQDSRVQFIVEDSGIGIGPQHLKNLFQPFTQANDSLNRHRGGTGLGLYLSRKLASALGGTLELSRTQEHSGTTLVLSFPVEIGSLQAAHDWRTETSGCISNVLSLKDVRILIVDDSADNRRLIDRMLLKAGAVLDFASGGQAGVERVTESQHDLVLMDLQMPDMDGFEAVSQIRARQIQVPIVALTAHAIDEIRERCAKAGFNGFLTKPIDSKSLFQTLQKLIQPKSISAKNAGSDRFNQIQYPLL